jgi:hypothetical protein
MRFKPISMASIANKTEDTAAATTIAPVAVAKRVVKTTLEDWVGNDEGVNGFYNSNQKDRRIVNVAAERSGKRIKLPPPLTNLDDIYDPLQKAMRGIKTATEDQRDGRLAGAALRKEAEKI